MKKKNQKVYRDHGFGFPIILLNVPMIQARDEWVPNIDQKELQERVIEALVLKQSRLTGSEIRFIRLFSGMTLEQFAERFDVTHPAVLKWEGAKNLATSMNWTTEKDIRLSALNKLAPKAQEFLVTYQKLVGVVPAKTESVKIDLEKRSA